jgi:tetratricopeptide (TPR) repeat protein
MDSELNFERARVLYEQGRFADAEKELRMALNFEPGNAYYLSMLALCCIEQKKTTEAKQLALDAIGFAPDAPFVHYVASSVFLADDNMGEAERHIMEAIHIDPFDANYFAILASVKLNQKKFQEALDAANQGLQADPENISCLNLRSTAQTKLGLKDEAYDTIREALNQNPDNPYTHANTGWGLLERGEHKKALEHFREALSRNPNMEHARAGMVEALKAKYWFYRIFLRYTFWIANMESKMQWFVILGFYFGSRLINTISKSVPQLAPFLLPVKVLYFLFAISTWLVTPISNLLLRLNVYGRFLLTEEEVTTSNLVGIALGSGLVTGIAYLFTGSDSLLILALICFTISIPLSTVLRPSKPGGQRMLIFYTISLLIVGLSAVVLNVNSGPAGIITMCLTVYMIGIFAYQFVANFIIMR